MRAIISGQQDEGRQYTGRQTRSRFASTPIGDRLARLPPIDSVAMRTLRTLYPTTVRDGADEMVLKSGHHSPKIGARVLKGKWRGLPVYTLTLEERATCPVSCRHLRSCFGNKMHFARRFAHGPVFERRLVEDVVALAKRHPAGFVVRVHVLGDFYSVRYVQLWRAMLETVPALNAFGYTARWDDEIGEELRRLVGDHWERFAVRFSNAPTNSQGWSGYASTVSIELPVQCPADAVVCPEQAGRTESCATCGFCWHSRRRVAFIQH